MDVYPERVAELEALLPACRADIGDSATGVAGANIRAIGRIDDPKPLTTFDQDHPYINAAYDKEDAG